MRKVIWEYYLGFLVFLGKYHEYEENYEKSRNPFFRFVLLIGTAATPVLLFWGASTIEKNSFGAILGFLF